MWNTLLPYLLGAGSAFIAQYIVQAYAVPLTDTRARREERWEKDVRDYGDLLTTSARDLAYKAHRAQLAVQMVISGEIVPDQEMSAAQLDAFGAKLLQDSRQATHEFRDAMGIRADWIADRIIGFRVNSDLIVRFGVASYRYRVMTLGSAVTRDGEVPIAEIEAYWAMEGKARAELLAQVKVLALLRHPPRASLWRQIRSAWRTITARAKRKRPELAASNAQAAVSLTGESASNSATPEVGAEASSPSS